MEVLSMKAVGCVRQIDKLGRLVIPSYIRKSLDLEKGIDFVEFFTDGDSIIIKKYRPACVFCKSDEKLTTFKEQMICETCLEELKKDGISLSSAED